VPSEDGKREEFALDRHTNKYCSSKKRLGACRSIKKNSCNYSIGLGFVASMNRSIVTLACVLVSLLSDGHAQSAKKARNKPAGEIWSAAEYSGSRTPDNLRIALASKGFTWLSGSPADNEKLSVGKNAQFFGFVALRYQSGRAANRGVLGRAFNSNASDTQRKILHEAVIEEPDDLTAW